MLFARLIKPFEGGRSIEAIALVSGERDQNLGARIRTVVAIPAQPLREVFRCGLVPVLEDLMARDVPKPLWMRRIACTGQVPPFVPNPIGP